MTTETICTITPEDGHSFDSDDIVTAFDEALAASMEVVNRHLYCYVQLDDGRMIASLRVEKETLSDGSIVCNIVMVPVAV